MKKLDIVMELLADSSWHSLEEIKKEISLNIELINEIINFLQELKLVERKDDNLKITEKGLKFLDINY